MWQTYIVPVCGPLIVLIRILCPKYCNKEKMSKNIITNKCKTSWKVSHVVIWFIFEFKIRPKKIYLVIFEMFLKFSPLHMQMSLRCRCVYFAFPPPRLFHFMTIRGWLFWAKFFMAPCMWKLMIGLSLHALKKVTGLKVFFWT